MADRLKSLLKASLLGRTASRADTMTGVSIVTPSKSSLIRLGELDKIELKTSLRLSCRSVYKNRLLKKSSEKKGLGIQRKARYKIRQDYQQIKYLSHTHHSKHTFLIRVVRF